MRKTSTSTLALTFDWEEVRRQFQCPAQAWTGAWAAVGAEMPKRLDVWLATYTALAALAGRNMHWYYVGANMYGMVYSLCIAPTGSCKQLPADICNALLPEGYQILDAVQSGPGVLTALQGKTRDDKGIWDSVPTLFIVTEWTKLVKNSGIQHSTLGEDLNSIFHRPHRWNVTRSNRDGGGNHVIHKPTLSIFGTTTPEAFLAEVGEAHISSGFINRYLILPGGMRRWEFWPNDMDLPESPDLVLKDVAAGWARDLTGHTLGKGRKFPEAFTPEAAEAMRIWGQPYFGSLMAEATALSNIKARLHFYAYHIALLSTWARKAHLVQLQDVAMATCAVETSAKFIDFLYHREVIPLTTVDFSNAMVEQALLARIEKNPGFFTAYKLRESLRRQGVTMAKITAVLDPLIRNKIVRIDPDSMGLVKLADEPLFLRTLAPGRPTRDEFLRKPTK